MNVMFICLALLLWTVRVHKQGYHSIQQLQKTCSQVTCKNNFHSSLTTGLPGETEQRGPPRSLRARPLAEFFSSWLGACSKSREDWVQALIVYAYYILICYGRAVARCIWFVGLCCILGKTLYSQIKCLSSNSHSPSLNPGVQMVLRRI